MKLIPNAIANKVARQALLGQKHSPAILFGTGVVGMVGSTVLACRATLKLEEVLHKAESDMSTARSMAADMDLVYSDKDKAHDSMVIRGRLITDMAKLYVPAVVVGAASVACLTKSHRTLQQRNLALTAAYAAVSEGFEAYRERVVEKYGEEQDREFRYNGMLQETVDENGKMIEALRADPNAESIYSRWYDEESSRSWDPDPDINRLFLTTQQNFANDLLRSRGHLFLNEVYSMLGLSHTKEGAVVGWRYVRNNEEGDNHVDFGIWEAMHMDVRDFYNGREGGILLDFNVDGVIYDLLKTAAES